MEDSHGPWTPPEKAARAARRGVSDDPNSMLGNKLAYAKPPASYDSFESIIVITRYNVPLIDIALLIL